MTSGDRLEKIRAHLRLTQAEMCERLGVALRTYSHYVSGRPPAAEALEAIGRLGFSIYWLLTGEGEMRQGAAPTPAPTGAATIDADLVGRVLEAIAAVYKEMGWGKSLHQLGAEAARIAEDIAAEGLAPDERPAAVKVAAAMLRRQLRDAVTNPTGDAAKQTRA